MIRTGIERAFAKLNLSLDVLGTLEDGYHDLLMVMQSASLCDELRVTLTDDGMFRALANLSYLPRDERNIAVKAARAFLQAAGLPGAGAEIEIMKRIPVGAGLGGGSSDASAVLRALNRLTGANLDTKALETIAASVGSDVPFCVAGGTALARGRGELLTPLPALPPCFLVICKPSFSISTPELFSRIDNRASPIRPDTDGLIRCLETGDIRGVARRMYNVFEDVLPRQCGEIMAIKGKLLDRNALGVTMTGTGSAVIGLFSDEETALGAYRALASEYKDCFLTQAVGRLCAD
jgi:4-diphosphocytidyl-2-C-methyl-D-erythritol kinase